jgi:hypothetical protein
MDFEFTAVARTGIHLAYRQAATQPAPRCYVDARRKFREFTVVEPTAPFP